MSALNKHQILGAVDTQTLKVEVPEWGGDVYLRVMTVGERDEYENEWLRSKDRGMANFRTKFLGKCLCDEKGVRLFTDAELGELAKKSATVMNRLWNEAMKFNALREEDVEQIAGN
jgi:hypothetical protein